MTKQFAGWLLAALTLGLGRGAFAGEEPPPDLGASPAVTVPDLLPPATDKGPPEGPGDPLLDTDPFRPGRRACQFVAGWQRSTNLGPGTPLFRVNGRLQQAPDLPFNYAPIAGRIGQVLTG